MTFPHLRCRNATRTVNKEYAQFHLHKPHAILETNRIVNFLNYLFHLLDVKLLHKF